eukprot:m.128393 g.128393  ORF g.128393 m.128393 type:complete len:363 (-) comp13624_c0_seq2:199-1287(-)
MSPGGRLHSEEKVAKTQVACFEKVLAILRTTSCPIEHLYFSEFPIMMNILAPSLTPLFRTQGSYACGVSLLISFSLFLNSCTRFDVYEWVGRLCAGAILSDESLVLRFPPLIWKLLGGADVSMEDLEEVDYWFVRNKLKIVEEYPDVELGGMMVQQTEEMLKFCGLTYAVQRSDGCTVDLVSGGRNKDVDWGTRFEYQRLACQARLRESAEQIAAIRRGLTAIIPTPLLGMWTAAEFELAVCGTPNISVDELRRTARYSINRDAAEVGFLFEALEGMTNEERSLFLRFVTGRARLPASIKICSLSGPPSSLPVSHTCFNQIDIPKYESAQQAAEKIHYAIANTRTMDTDYHPRGEQFDLDVD